MIAFALIMMFAMVPTLFGADAYRITAIRYATISKFPVSSLVVGAPEGDTLDIAMVVWLLQGDGRNVLFDSGYYHKTLSKRFNVTDFIRPDEAVKLAGVEADEITDIIISHAHWDHMGGIDLFPNATVWIQKEEFEYYLGPAWQEGGNHGGIDPEDLHSLVRRNTEGKVRFVDGDDVEIFPGIRAFSGARHTFASQYILVEGEKPVILASDNCYLYRNLAMHLPVATFAPGDSLANLAALDRMLFFAGAPERVIPGHDPEQFDRFDGEGRIATIR